MIYLYENSLGYYLFSNDQETLELLKTYKFKNNIETLESYTKLINEEAPQNLINFLNDFCSEAKKSIGVCDQRLKTILCESLKQNFEYTNDRVFYDIREYISKNEDEKDLRSATLYLAHKLASESVKINIDKIDTMIIQSIILLGDLDKDINMHCMRLREWYGFHFPELGDAVEDNMAFVLSIIAIGKRTAWKDDNASLNQLDDLKNKLLDIVGESNEKIVGLIFNSMGTDMSDEDIENILDDCRNIARSFEYRKELLDYIKTKMNILAPNVSSLVGEVMGARLISKCGSLENLSKLPSSTVQLLGAEKSLFMALRKKVSTPKYGMIYESGILGPVALQFKGKVARTLASKITLCARVDALGENKDNSFGKLCKITIEKRIKSLENRIKTKKKKSNKSKFIITNEEVIDYSKDAKRIKRD